MPYYAFQNSEQRIVIGKIVCLARTYKKHAREMHTNTTKDPLLFLKPASAVIFSGDSIYIPKVTKCLHHEVELGIVIGKKCINVLPHKALEYVLGYLVALDITARDIQLEAKKRGWPWSVAKGFDTFAPISSVVKKEEIMNPNNIDLLLKVNGEIRQHSNTKYMIYPAEKIISFVSGIMTLERGDLIMTGTPEGVGEIKEGDILQATLDNICSLTVDVRKK